jgi:hypothetical protein
MSCLSEKVAANSASGFEQNQLRQIFPFPPKWHRIGMGDIPDAQDHDTRRTLNARLIS